MKKTMVDSKKMSVDNEVLYIGRTKVDDLIDSIANHRTVREEKKSDLPEKRLDGVNVVGVEVTDESNEAVGVTIVEHEEVIDEYFGVDKELHN